MEMAQASAGSPAASVRVLVGTAFRVVGGRAGEDVRASDSDKKVAGGVSAPFSRSRGGPDLHDRAVATVPLPVLQSGAGRGAPRRGTGGALHARCHRICASALGVCVGEGRASASSGERSDGAGRRGAGAEVVTAAIGGPRDAALRLWRPGLERHLREQARRLASWLASQLRCSRARCLARAVGTG